MHHKLTDKEHNLQEKIYAENATLFYFFHVKFFGIIKIVSIFAPYFAS